MKLHNDAAPIERIGMGEASEFRIKATAKAFRILSSGLYKDKIGAIVRELSANAYDAHKAANTVSTPFHVHIPNAMEPFFSIRDFGPGLDPDQVHDIYTTYFESTKSDSNEYVGALGLGCKSPFSYVNSFNIVSRTGGMRRTYDVFISEAGIPAIALRSEIESDEPTGLEVIVPVTNRHDCIEFRQRAIAAYEHYPVKPIVLGDKIEFPETKILLEGPGYKFISNGGHHGTARAIMGVVAYPINSNSALGMDALYASDSNYHHTIYNDPRYKLMNSRVDVQFEIGELDVTAGREELSYDKNTIKALQDKFQFILDDVRKQLDMRFANCKTILEAKLLLWEIYNKNQYLINLRPTVAVRGQRIDSTAFTIAAADCKNTTIHSFADNRSPYTFKYVEGQNHQAKFTVDAIQIARGKCKFFVKDDCKNVPARIKNFTKDNDCDVVLIECNDEKDLTRLKKVFDGVSFTPVSSLPMPEPKLKTAVSAKVLSSHVRGTSAIRGSFDAYTWDKCDIDLANGGNALYVPTYHNQLTLSNRDFADSHTTELVSTLIQYAVHNKLLDLKTERLYAIPATLRDKKMSGWVALDEELARRAKEQLKEQPEILAKILRNQSYSKFKNERSGSGEIHTIDYLCRAAQLIGDEKHPFVVFATEFFAQKKHNGTVDQYGELLYGLNRGFKPDENPYDLSTMYSSLLAKYPMLRLCNFTTDASRESKNTIVEYVNQIDGLPTKKKKGTKVQ